MKATIFPSVIARGMQIAVAIGYWTLAASAETPKTYDEGLAALQEGNARFATGKPAHPHEDAARRAEVAKGQHPFVTVLSCADSRVPVELLLDQGLGDTFVVRVAGNVSDTDEIGTIEYGVGHLGTPLLVILGHTGCGAVKAVLEGAEVHGNLRDLVDNISPAVAQARTSMPGSPFETLLTKAVTANVWLSMDDLFKRSSEVRELVKAHKLKAVGAVYDLETGRVKWLGEHPEESRLLAYRGDGGGEGKDGHGSAHAASVSPAAMKSSHGAAAGHEASGSATEHGGSPETGHAGAAEHHSISESGAGFSRPVMTGLGVVGALAALAWAALHASRLSAPSTRIWVNSALLVTLLLGASGYAWQQFSSLGRELDAMAADDLPFLSNLAQLEAKMLEEELDLERFASSTNTYFAAEFGRVGAEVDHGLGVVQVELSKAAIHAAGDKARKDHQWLLERVKKLSDEHTHFDQYGLDLVAAVKGGHRERVAELKSMVARAGHEMHATVTHMAEMVKDATRHDAIQIQTSRSQTQSILVIVSLMGLGIGVVSAAYIVRRTA